jgi:hypothetical protein
VRDVLLKDCDDLQKGIDPKSFSLEQLKADLAAVSL